MHTQSIRYTAFLFMVAAAAWGAVWLGPAGGWTSVSGTTGYVADHVSEPGHDAWLYGAVLGIEDAKWSGRARVLASAAASGEQPYRSGWGTKGRIKLDYRESALDAAAFRRTAAASPFRLGLTCRWLHTARVDENYYPGPISGPVDDLAAVTNRVINEYSAGPTAGLDMGEGPVIWRLEGSVRYQHFLERADVVAREYWESGLTYMALYERSSYRDSLGLGIETSATWFMTPRLQATVWAAAGGGVLRLGSYHGDARSRWDVVVGVTPSVTFL